MQEVTEADRQAARDLRELLADLSGFWYRIDDDGPLCAALARHRMEAEQRLIAKLTPVGNDIAPASDKDAQSRALMVRKRGIGPYLAS